MPSSRLMMGLVASVLALGLLTFGWTLRSAVYHAVPEAHAYQGGSTGPPPVSIPGTANNMQGAVAPGAVVGLELAPAPTPTATLATDTDTPTSTPTATDTPTSTPTASYSDWSLVVDGLVQSPLNLTLDDLVAMPSTTVYAKLYCVWGPLVTEGNWTGVRLGLVLEQAGVSPEAIKVAFYADDGFTTDLTVTTAMRNDIILAYEKDGQPLAEKLRLVVPGKWGYKWISSLTQIVLVDYDFLGQYESEGFSDEADNPGFVADTDGDGCTVTQEAAMGFDDTKWYDFVDVPVPANADPAPNGSRDKAITMADVLAVLRYVGTFDGDGGVPNFHGVAYDSVKGSCDWNGDTVPDKEGLCYDRSPSPPPNPPWEGGPPNGAVAMNDVLAALAQVGLVCVGPP